MQHLNIIIISLSAFALISLISNIILVYKIKALKALNHKHTKTIDALQKEIQNEKRLNSSLQHRIKHAKQQLEQKEADLLKTSVNPHFFKNVMAQINAYAINLKTSLDYLSPVLNYVVYDSIRENITIKDELNFIKQFIQLSSVGAHPDFEISEKIAPVITDHYGDFQIMPLIFVNIIENAFKYNDINNPHGILKYKLFIDEQQFLCFELLNTINPNSNNHNKRGGFGLENLIKRLDCYYHGKYRLKSEINGPYTYFTQLSVKLNDNHAN